MGVGDDLGGSPLVDGRGVPVTAASLPDSAVEAAWHMLHADEDPGTVDMREMRYAVFAAMQALGCVWDDDQGSNSMRRIVGAWIDKP